MKAVLQLKKLFVGCFQAVIVADNRNVVRHDLAHFLMQLVLILWALVSENLFVDLLLAFQFVRMNAVCFGYSTFHILCVLDRGWCGRKAAVDARYERVSTETICSVDRIVAFARGKKAGNVGALF